MAEWVHLWAGGVGAAVVIVFLVRCLWNHLDPPGRR